jgi:hypothetical protein
MTNRVLRAGQGGQMAYFQTKIPIWVNFGGPWNGNASMFYDHLDYFTSIWYNLWPFGTVCCHLVHFFPFWYVLATKNLATLYRNNVEKATKRTKKQPTSAPL